MVSANFPFYLNFSWKIEKKTCIKFKKWKKQWAKSEEKILWGGKKFFFKALPPPRKIWNGAPGTRPPPSIIDICIFITVHRYRNVVACLLKIKSIAPLIFPWATYFSEKYKKLMAFCTPLFQLICEDGGYKYKNTPSWLIYTIVLNFNLIFSKIVIKIL